MRRSNTHERRILYGNGPLLPPGPALASSSLSGPTPLLLTPLNGASFGGRDIDADTVTMFAEIPAGAPAVTKVDFLVGASIVGTANAFPWQFQWATTQGSYAVKAQVTYADDSVGTSSVANITVAAPTTAPLPTTIAAVKFWADFGHANTLNPGGTQAAIGDQVASYGRFADGTVVTSQATQATTTKRCRLGLWRGKNVLETCTNSVTTENYSYTLNGAQSFPSTLITVYRGISIQSAGVVCGSNGSERIGLHNTTAPRNDRCTGSLAINDALAQATATSTLCTLNNTNSRIMRQGADVHNPAALGTTGVSNNISFPGTTAGSPEPGVAAEHIYAQTALTAQNITDLNTFVNAKFDINPSNERRIVYVGDSQTIPLNIITGGWRKLLHDYFHQGKVAGGWIEEVGTQGSSPRTYGGDTHDGVSLKGIAYHSNATPGAGGLPTLLGAGLFFQPDIMFLQIGINNAAQVAPETYVAGNAAGSTRQAFRDLVTLILNAMPSPAQLIVANLINHPTPAVQTNVVTMNSTWFQDADDAATALGRTVVHCDWNTPAGTPPGANFQADGHFTDTGCAAVEPTVRAAIVKAAYKFANGIA